MSDRIEGTAGDDNQNVAQGKDIQQVSIYTDRLAWREAVRDEFATLYRQVTDLRGVVRGLLIAICIAFALGFMASLLALRQFDLQSFRIERTIDRIERLERIDLRTDNRTLPPTPILPIP